VSAVGINIDLVSTTEQFDPTNGPTTVEEYLGTESACQTAFNNALLFGGKPVLGKKGGAHSLTIRWAFPDQKNGGVEVPNDVYTLDMEEVQPSIWAHPTITRAADASGNPYTYRNTIEEFVKNPEDFDPVDPVTTQLVQYLLRGGTSFASHTPVLSRQRTFSTKYPTRIKVVAVEPVYTPNGLVSTFGIPASVAAQLPDVPSPSAGATPTGTVWAWKLRRQNSRFVPALNKTEETMDWVFQAWASWVYPVVG
jgi:hypothetical protein